MHLLRDPRSAAFGRWLSGWLSLGLLVFTAHGTGLAAEPPQPAQKDSSARAKPKDVSLTTAIEPEEALPGETVVLKITARLKPGWHIYTQAKAQVGQGPRKTVFDLFDPGGLEPAGDWKASKNPESKPEPAFDNQVFEFFNDEVTWSIPLRVPTGAAPGKRSIRTQASYQICNEKSCSFPGRWTLPEAVLTIKPGGQAAAAPVGSGNDVQRALPTQDNKVKLVSAALPRTKDSNPRIKPRQVVLTPSADATNVEPGGSVTYRVTAKLQPGWHIYAIANEDEQHEGPIPTSFDFFEKSGLIAEGNWKSSSEPECKPEPAFDNKVFCFHENEVTWGLSLRIPPDATAGRHVLKCQARYQVCDPKSCSPEGRWTLPDVVINVLPAGSATSASGTGSSATTTKEPARFVEPGPSAAVGPTKLGEVVTPGSGSESPKNSGASPPAPLSEIARKAQQGLLQFLIASALGGLFALVMPCVWPMIPITVNFFVKQGQTASGKGKTTALAITYCLAIIAVFTTLGVFFSFFFSASFLQNLANNPWLNLVVAGLFLAFGLSLLGLFEIRLPGFLLNASSKGESRGGIIGVIFMALTLTITSFTCTFPVVGGLLVMAAGGNFLYPILGLATFSAVLAFPFFILALAPGLISKMPRSGDWMNAVKVVGGLVEIGAALKFINTAELGYVTPENAWFDANVVLTSWIALSAVCGLYLLGIFQTDHDHDTVKVGPGRLVCGVFFLGLALFMSPALFGRPPRSLVWDRLIAGILPPDSSEFASGVEVAGRGEDSRATGMAKVKATSSDPEQAQREEKKFHGVQWGMSLEQAKELARNEKRPILIDFTGVNCANCRTMELRVLPLPEIVQLLKQFVTVQLYTDRVPIDSITSDQRKSLAEKNQELQLDLAQEATNPIYVVLSPDGKLVEVLGGLTEPPVFQDFLSKSLAKARGGMNIAQMPTGP